jgi:hypothetical protein
MNELFWILMLVLNFLAIMTAFRLWGKIGLFIWIPISVIVANIQVTETVVLFGLEATLGNIVYGTSFLATDLINECYGKKEARKAVWIGFFALIVMTVLMNAALLFIPAESDFAHESLKNIFSIMPRIATGSLIAYLAANFEDIWSFELWRRFKPGKVWLWLRSKASTFVSQIIDTVLFTLIAFWGVYPWEVLWQIMFTTYLLKWIVAVCDTPFMYLGRSWYDKGLIKDGEKRSEGFHQA